MSFAVVVCVLAGNVWDICKGKETPERKAERLQDELDDMVNEYDEVREALIKKGYMAAGGTLVDWLNYKVTEL